jgi:putative peptide zinc metalloprotease protein
MPPEATPLRPKFRKDLIAAEHVESDNSKVIILKDPVSGKYFRLSPHEYQFLKVFDGKLTVDEALETLKTTGKYLGKEEASAVLGRAANLGLLLGTRLSTAAFLSSVRERAKQAKRAQSFSSVYFLFVPLLNPDLFLERTLRLYDILVNKWTGAVAAVLGVGAVYLVISGLSRMHQEYLFFFNLNNLIYLWITIALTKLVHEFAHAYTAKHFGLHVPRMGLALLIFFPCLYCDTTDAWQLADRKQRMAISAAGIIAEAVVATIACYVWHFSREGMVNSLAFYLMAVSFISTVLFNGNPLMKFDGYFLLIDYIEIPNLRGKALGYVKYLFMNEVLGLTQFPDTAADARQRFIFTVYGVSSFLYLVSLYTGIAMKVYYRFDKTLGFLLFVLALSLFVVKPIVKGAKTVYANRGAIHLEPRGTIWFAAIAASVLIVLCIPISSRSVYPCYVGPAHSQKLTAPLDTAVEKVRIKRGASVKKGDVLFELDTTPLELDLVKAELKRSMLQKELEIILVDAKERGKAAGKQMEIYKAEDDVNRVKRDLAIAGSGITAPFDGVVTNMDYKLQPGFQPGDGVVVGELASPDSLLIHALVPEADRHKVKAGHAVEIWLPVAGGLILTDKIAEVRAYSEKDLRESPFSSRLGGELATEVKGEQQQDAPLEAQYRATVSMTNQDLRLPLGLTGRLSVPSPPRSLLFRFFDEIFRTFMRETLV